MRVNLRSLSTSSLHSHRSSQLSRIPSVDILSPRLKDSHEAQSPIKPGFFFFDSLLKAPRGDITTLAINVPTTLYTTDKVYFLDTVGTLTVSTCVHPFEFLKLLEHKRPATDDALDRVAAVLRVNSSSPGDMKKLVLDWHQLNLKMRSGDNARWSMFQQYIKSAGDQPSVVRLHYFADTRLLRANYGVVFVSRRTSTSLQSAVLDTARGEAVASYPLTGKPLVPFETEALKLVTYLNHGYNLRIETIVLDFLRDVNGTVYLCGCKGLTIDPTSLHSALAPLDTWAAEHSSSISRPRSPSVRGSSVQCKLCRADYSSRDLSHQVSVRMLVVFKEHISKRLTLPFEVSLPKATNSEMLSQSLRICSSCYLLVSSEFELIRIQGLVAHALNVDAEVMPRLGRHPVQFLPKQLMQWRVLVLASHLFEFRSQHADLRLHIKLGTMTTSFCITGAEKRLAAEPCIALHVPQLLYFFSQAEEGVATFFKRFTAEFSIMEGSKRVCKGSSAILSKFPQSLTESALCESKQVRLYDREYKSKGLVSVIIGLSQDKIVNRNVITVPVKRQDEVYLPDRTFMTADALPDPWVERIKDLPQLVPLPHALSTVSTVAVKAETALADSPVLSAPKRRAPVRRTQENWPSKRPQYRKKLSLFDKKLSEIHKFCESN